jgi:catechol 2,3-dioxygenase-like lactoylglutathione lyase family enzyme
MAIWVKDLENMKAFYVENFGATVGEKYINEIKGFHLIF